MILSADENYRRMQFRMGVGIEKKTPWWNQKAIPAKRDAFKTSKNRPPSELQAWFSEMRKAAAQAKKLQSTPSKKTLVVGFLFIGKQRI